MPPDSPAPRRRIRTLALQLGILGLFTVALAFTAIGFALFGCNCITPEQVYRSNNRPDGMIVNPPDPPLRPAAK